MDKNKTEPEYDALNKRMKFMEALKILTELDEGKKSGMSFHIVDKVTEFCQGKMH